MSWLVRAGPVRVTTITDGEPGVIRWTVRGYDNDAAMRDPNVRSRAGEVAARRRAHAKAPSPRSLRRARAAWLRFREAMRPFRREYRGSVAVPTMGSAQ